LTSSFAATSIWTSVGADDASFWALNGSLEVSAELDRLEILRASRTEARSVDGIDCKDLIRHQIGGALHFVAARSPLRDVLILAVDGGGNHASAASAVDVPIVIWARHASINANSV